MAAYSPVGDATFWFAVLISAVIVSTFLFVMPRAVYPRERASAVQRWLYLPFLAIAMGSLVVLVGFAVTDAFGA